MTFIDKAGLVLNVCVGGIIASISYKIAGWLSGVLGFMLGFFASYLVCIIIACLAGAIWRMWHPLPSCKKCNSRNYKVHANTETCAYLICRCGEKYMRKGRVFMCVNEAGEAEPYMRYDSLFRNWHADKSTQNNN